MIYSPHILVQLIGSLILLVGACVLLDLQREHLDVSVFTLFACVVVGVLNLFLYCFFGKLATQSFAKMADSLYESNWQTLSVKCQKYVVIMIQSAQEPLCYQGFGVAVMNLETFTKFLNAVWSYYMVIKTITSK